MSGSNLGHTEAASAANMGVVVGGRNLSRKRQLWVAAITAIIILGGLGGWFYSYKVSQRVTYDDLTNLQNQADVSVKNANGNVQSGLNIYNHAIANAADSATRAGLYTQAAVLATSNNMPDVALNYALKADAISHTADSSGLVASIYRQKGNTAEAAAYYRKAASEVKSNQLPGESSQYYLDEARSVSGSSK